MKTFLEVAKSTLNHDTFEYVVSSMSDDIFIETIEVYALYRERIAIEQINAKTTYEVEKLALLVKNMRIEQKAYFATRNLQHLNKSKELEKQVDSAVKDILDPDQQLKLL